MKKNARIYIAGHAGLVGGAIHDRLKDLGYTNIITAAHDSLDLTRQEATEAFFRRKTPEYVFLAAAKVGGILANDTYKAEFIYDNSAIALNVIHAAHKYGTKKLLNLGSACIYPKNAPQPLREESLLAGKLEPTNEPYAVAKILAVKLCRYYNEQYGTNFISAMPTNLYGVNDNFDLFESHVLPAMMRKFHLAKLLSQGRYDDITKDLEYSGAKACPGGGPEGARRHLAKAGVSKDSVTLWGSGSVYREFLHARDVADACVLLMRRADARSIGEIVNIGSGEELRIKELALMVKKVVGYRGDIKWDKSLPDGMKRKLLDTSKMRELGWAAKIKLEDGIREVYRAYCKAR